MELSEVRETEEKGAQQDNEHKRRIYTRFMHLPLLDFHPKTYLPQPTNGIIGTRCRKIRTQISYKRHTRGRCERRVLAQYNILSAAYKTTYANPCDLNCLECFVNQSVGVCVPLNAA